MKTLGKLWRIIASGFCFAFFGMATWLASLALLPLYRWKSSSTEEYRRKVQRLVQGFFRLFTSTIEFVGVMKLQFRGEESLQPNTPCVVVANHPTLIDVVLLLSRLPQTTCIIKASLYENFFLKHMVSAAGFICNRGNTQDLIDQCVEALQRGDSLLVFPEGTRSLGHQLQPFQRGAARVALRHPASIVPIVITCEPPALQKGQPWYDVPSRAFKVTLEVQSPLTPTDHIKEGAPSPAAARQLTRHLKGFFEQELARRINSTEESQHESQVEGSSSYN